MATKKEELKKAPTALVPWQEAQHFNLPAVPTAMSAINPELAAEIDPTDFAGYEDDGAAFPIVEIRQKDLKDEKGKTTAPAGGFKMFDPIMGKDSPVPDVDGEAGLYVTIIADQSSRVYFPEVGGNPACRSGDGVTGFGNNSTGDGEHDCATCPLAQMSNGNRAACKAQKNLLVFDLAAKRYYNLRVGPSGLSPWKNYKEYVKRANGRAVIPISALVTHVTSEYEAEPAPHYRPKFGIADQLSVDLFREIKAVKAAEVKRLAASAQIVTTDEDSPNSHVKTVHPELPEGVTPVDLGDNKNDEDLPF